MGINWFDEGLITAISPTLVRRLRVCEYREEFNSRLRHSARHDHEKNGFAHLVKEQKGETFHRELFVVVMRARARKRDLRFGGREQSTRSWMENSYLGLC